MAESTIGPFKTELIHRTHPPPRTWRAVDDVEVAILHWFNAERSHDGNDDLTRLAAAALLRSPNRPGASRVIQKIESPDMPVSKRRVCRSSGSVKSIPTDASGSAALARRAHIRAAAILARVVTAATVGEAPV